jgi:glycyl-tRNA synthetase beta chain
VDAVKEGNRRVLRARLDDARFYWNEDLKTTLEEKVPDLERVVWLEGFGSLAEKTRRVGRLAGILAAKIAPGEEDAIARAALLSKSDLVTEMIKDGKEFTSLQGVMGREYALRNGEPEAVALALEEQYRPRFAGDGLPRSGAGACLAVADRIDTLVGVWAAGLKPTGSKDPFALRRAALGSIRIIIDNTLRVPLMMLFAKSAQLYKNQLGAKFASFADIDLLVFFSDRLKVALRDKGVRHDLIDAVFALRSDATPMDDLLIVTRRVQALQNFLSTDDGKNLLAGYKRATNIVKIEEGKEKKKDAKHLGFTGKPDVALMQALQEIELFKALAIANDLIASEVAQERFEEAMRAMSRLRAPVDAFFDKVTVNTDDPALRENRLKLLNDIRAAMHTVADFSKIEG